MKSRVSHQHLSDGCKYTVFVYSDAASDDWRKKEIERELSLRDIKAEVIPSEAYSHGFLIECRNLADAAKVERYYGASLANEYMMLQTWQHLTLPWATLGPANMRIELSLPEPDLHGVKDMLARNTRAEVNIVVGFRNYIVGFADEEDYIWARMALV